MSASAGNPGRQREVSPKPGGSTEPRPSATGTRRRLRALAVRSWSPEALARETGISAQLIRRELGGHDSVAPDLAGQVAAAYDRIWDRPPPAGMPADRAAAAETAGEAARQGWAPPMAWDDGRIDLPGAGPEAGWRRRRQLYLRSADLAEDAGFVRESNGLRDASIGEVAERSGVNHGRLRQVLVRTRRRAAAHSAVAGRWEAGDAGREAEAG